MSRPGGMSRPWRQEDVDPYYTRFRTSVRDEETLDHMVEPVVRRFAGKGLRTVITADREQDAYLIHCIAVRLLKGEIPKPVSEQVAPKTLDAMQTAARRQAEMEPLGVHFGPPMP